MQTTKYARNAIKVLLVANQMADGIAHAIMAILAMAKNASISTNVQPNLAIQMAFVTILKVHTHANVKSATKEPAKSAKVMITVIQILIIMQLQLLCYYYSFTGYHFALLSISISETNLNLGNANFMRILIPDNRINIIFIKLDINECAANSHRCSSNTQKCVNSKGSYKCICKSGFKSNGDQCNGKNSLA